MYSSLFNFTARYVISCRGKIVVDFDSLGELFNLTEYCIFTDLFYCFFFSLESEALSSSMFHPYDSHPFLKFRKVLKPYVICIMW